MQVTNTEYFRELPFDQYLAIPGTSFSSLKGNIPQSAGMKLGTLVHQYLGEPDQYNWEQADIVIPIATELRRYVGDAFEYLENELAFTSLFSYNGLTMKYKGRADLAMVGRVVVDFKVLSGNLANAVARFGYDNQMSGYCLATGASLGIILSYNKAKEKAEVYKVKPIKTDFWQYQVCRFGKPAQKVML